MIVLDTNVLSEALRPRPADSVRRWMEAQPASDLFTTTICEAEMFYGLRLMAAGRRRTALERAVEAIFAEEFTGRVLAFDRAAARSFADIAARRHRSGRPIREFDAQIAAIAASNRAMLATRNVEDFVGCGVEVLNPWQT